MVSWHDCRRGIPGIALLVLRIAVAAMVLLEAQHQSLLAGPTIVTFLVETVAVGIVLGILTFVFGFAAVLGGLLLLETGHIAISGSCIVTLLICGAVSTLGPGGYSFDCLLFGWRRIVLDSRKTQTK